ncbi:hypothetical protein [Rhizobium leguminosarum]|uniref:hypothetical protein n=1 Tax=Rhizobium leguminosarum TaxID=384 RepID=UPI001C979DDC|nr:hypothetical protein [Rhizobium leguminosarum]MBY5812906.1 hypothetical protein [Rhizobium leguminosarum]
MAKRSHTTIRGQEEKGSLAADHANVAANFAKMLALTEERRDLVLEYGRQLGTSINRYDELDKKSTIAHREKRDRDKTMFGLARDEEYDRELAIRAMIALTKASSLEGVAIQLHEAIVTVAFLQDDFPEDAENNFPVKQRFRQLNRLLFSALGFVDKAAGEKLSSLIECSMPNPWTAPEEENARYAEWKLSQERDELKVVIEAHRSALNAWKDTARGGKDLECDTAEYDTFCEAEFAFISYKCKSHLEAQRKVSYAMECREARESIKADQGGDGKWYFSTFLESLRLVD